VLNAAVLGSPIAHSLSPVLHRAAYRALGLRDWRYAAHEVDEESFLPYVAGLDETWRGLSLTMPLKEVAFAVAADISPTALATGAINTLVRRETGEWDAHNTDVHGVVAALAGASAQDAGAARRSATVLGSGATARSVIAALAELGVRHVRLAVRSAVRPATTRMAADLGLQVEQVALEHWADWADAADAADWADRGGLVVSTLPAGAGAAAAEALEGHRIEGHRLEGTLLDVVYADWPTPLAAAAEAAGLTVVSGLDMLVHQAAEQVRLMTGREAPLQAMLAAGRQAVSR
jgi:shikimate dehydrogenase